MCRESRKLFEYLDELASKHGVQGIITPAHIYMCDTLMCQFFVAPVQNVIKNKLQHIGKKTSKQFEITYWDNMVRLMLNDKSAVRNNSISQQLNMESWDYLNNAMISDYSIEDAILMNKIIAQYRPDQIHSACKMAVQMNIRNMPYINAIIERAVAEHDYKIYKIDKMGERIEKSNELLNKPTVQHTTIDMAIAQYEYNKKNEEYELERKLREIYGGNQ